MKKKTLLAILLASCLSIFTVFTLSGCGNSEDEYEGTLDEDYDDEYYDEDHEDPYVDGMTLEDAKAWEDGSVFIMDNDVFYPLLPAYSFSGLLGLNSPLAFSEEDAGNFYFTPPPYSDYDLPVLSKGAKLVEVSQEDDSGSITYLPGETGWTIPYTFSYKNENYRSTDGSENDYTQSADLWNYNLFDGMTTCYYNVKSINNNPPDYSKIHNTALDIGKLDVKYALWYDCEPIIKALSAPDWKAICERNSMKPLGINISEYDYSCYMILDAKKDEEVELSYRSEDSVDTETEYAYADCRYYNLPTNISSPEHVKTFNNEYTQTEDGYSILKTSELASGIYVYDGGYRKTSLMFRVK